MTQSQSYIGQRIIDTCLRENVCELMSRGRLLTTLPADLARHWPGSSVSPQAWLQVSHLGTQTLFIPLEATEYLQHWRAAGTGWLLQPEPPAAARYSQGYTAWLECLAAGLTQEEARLFRDYILEADCAAEHRELCRQAYRSQTPLLRQSLGCAKQSTGATGVSQAADWHRQLLLSDQLAAYLDHPYYPTARAKVGFDAAALRRYAPEFAPRFELNWLAVDKRQVSLTSAVPACWPTMSQVGLAPELSLSHCLFPVHPLTLASLGVLPEGIIRAPSAYLTVQPTLSVRTLALVDFPGVHIKVPLLMATLGAKNIRLIKPSTLYDGHWFERALTRIAQTDAVIGQLFAHVDERHGGHLGEHKEFAYIVRRYPESMQRQQLVPVAALASEMPDGRLYLAHLADVYYQGDWQAWFDDYLSLLLRVHLRLWLKYGMALESNQQNAVLAYRVSGLSLVMKDNDSARLLPERYLQSAVECAVKGSGDGAEARAQAQAQLAGLLDRRILVEGDEALAQMFVTITLQLDIAAIIEAMAAKGLGTRAYLYRRLREQLIAELDALDAQGIATAYARNYLLQQSYLPLKYLLSSGSLLSKTRSGASDVNKFYGQSAPNFLLETLPGAELAAGPEAGVAAGGEPSPCQ
ncbi:IucA/IucC family protein [Shewanella salipaludis]|uniref:IucA/IucC family siderophore biosynthesis protein n=1 Tax=Shewanella salipaludis TaxID=2723052 RepID=A0A972FTT3_9GAMM|nr:IucA/IucC family protein [Shewanella salipaludis]NMH66078.1 IucA/IucC family siderophore biosynthesis protein [Shewanella salipaludis]